MSSDALTKGLFISILDDAIGKNLSGVQPQNRNITIIVKSLSNLNTWVTAYRRPKAANISMLWLIADCLTSIIFSPFHSAGML
jgi:hypothetical protein